MQEAALPNIIGYTGDLDRWRNALNNHGVMNAIGGAGHTNTFFFDWQIYRKR